MIKIIREFMDIFSCSFCNSELSTRYNLMKHLERCKSKKHVESEKRVLQIRYEYESKLQSQKQTYERQLQTQKQTYELQLQSLRHQLETKRTEVEQYKNQIFEIASQPKHIHTNHNTHNQRTVNIINQLAPYHLDADEIRQILLKHFTPEVFNGGPEKIAEVTVKYLLTDPQTRKRRVVCTDGSRRVYRYMDPDTHELQMDPGFQKTHKIIKRPLEQANLNLFLEKYAKNDVDDEYRDVWKRNDEFIEDQHKFPDKVFQYLK